MRGRIIYPKCYNLRNETFIPENIQNDQISKARDRAIGKARAVERAECEKRTFRPRSAASLTRSAFGFKRLSPKCAPLLWWKVTRSIPRRRARAQLARTRKPANELSFVRKPPSRISCSRPPGGRLVDGAEAELCAAAGVSGIPLELWDVPRARAEPEQRAVTGSPGTVGVNLDPIRPFVFANSIAPRLGIEMPRVASGTFASATISTSTTADAKVKSAESPATAGAFSVTTATPKRVSARLELTLEDIAAVGQENFESILRQNLALALSDELDDQAINGDGAAPNLTGIIKRLETIANPVDPTAVPTFDTFVAAFADSIDGLWSSTMKEIAIVAGVDTFKLSAKAFRDIAAADLGSISFADYAMMHTGGWWTNKGMPAAAATIQRAIVYRSGRTMAGGGMGMRTAVCPVWGEVAIDDVYSGSSKAERYFTFHVLLGDVILVQPDAYTLREFKVSA